MRRVGIQTKPRSDKDIAKFTKTLAETQQRTLLLFLYLSFMLDLSDLQLCCEVKACGLNLITTTI